ncbi:glycosyltransferase [Roseococcus sp. SYP-B2431]|uniref:glycosyltransferase n=1 Tax=Roseococcus sp. SYP-B2431 TaxID=2496640 RepID=UPI00103B46DA|nr:glycosyltransferase [Roseococcus sp. SYP-B2431]TCH97686.1 glycosyltransferase [Roseococcus sp. SYP-B2431]
MRLLLDLQGVQGAARHAGLGRYSLELARALIRGRGAHEVQVLVNTRLAEPAARLAEEFAPVLGHHAIRRWQAPEGSAAGSNPQAPRRLLAEQIRAQAIADAAPDILHLGSVFEGWRHDVVTTWPAGLERPAIAATVHDLIPLTLRETYLDGAWREAGLAPWYARCLDEVAACAPLLANSEATRDELLRHLRLPPERVVTIGGGVSPAFAPPRLEAGARDALLARYGLREGFLLYLGAGDLRKNEGVLLQAFARLPAALRAAHPLAIGHVNPPHLRAQARAAGLTESELIALPFVEEADLPGLYGATALFAMPSLAEGFGLPLLEAMACGAPCIASDTSAMPEVLGRADALFDPRDPAALAALLERLLAAPELRADLAAYGPRRAREFSWDKVASRAWAALEGARAVRRPGRPPRRRTLAIVAPLPPAASGIADYTAELAPALAAHYAVTLVGAAPAQGALAGRLPWMSEGDFAREGGRFDRVLYQIGNNPMHAAALTKLLPRFPGVVTLHDSAITDLRNWIDGSAAAPEPRILRLVREEGYPALVTSRELAGSAGLLADALGVVLHSGHARWLLEAEYGRAALRHVAVLPHLRQPPVLPGRAAARAALGLPEGAFVLASFGLMTPKKLPERILSGFAALARRDAAARLVFVGGSEEGAGPAVLEEAGRLGLASRVTVTGRVVVEDYRRWLAACDMAVQLRRGSRGESSGAVKDVLMAGLPLVANRHGSLSELEESGARLIPEEAELPDLAEALGEIRADAAKREAMGRAARAWALRELDPACIASAYAAVIERAHEQGPQSGMAAVLAASAGLPLTEADAGAVGAALAASFPPPRTPRLWLDTGLPAFEPGIVELLRKGLDGWRPEPCRWQEGRLVSAHGWAWARLGLPGAPPEEGPAAPAAGDAAITAPEAADAVIAAGARPIGGLQQGLLRGDGLAQRALVERLLPG